MKSKTVSMKGASRRRLGDVLGVYWGALPGANRRQNV